MSSSSRCPLLFLVLLVLPHFLFAWQQTPSHFIHEVQGDGAAVAISGQLVTVEAIVIGDFQRGDQLEGFFIQEEDADADDDPATSEGIFVDCGSCAVVVQVGDQVQVRGEPRENSNRSEIDIDQGSVLVLDSNRPLPTPVEPPLPAPVSTEDPAAFESVEGMLVRFPQPLFVSEYFQLARYGEIVLTPESRPRQFTHSQTPNASAYAAFMEASARSRIRLDDDNDIQNAPLPAGVFFHPQPAGFGLGTQGTDFFRGADRVTGLTAVMDWSGSGFSGTEAWRLRPVTTAFPIEFEPVNARPPLPTLQGNLRVAGMNLLNYFTTLDVGNNTTGPGNQSPRGAHSDAELERQTRKLVSALEQIDADVAGLVELENNDGIAIGQLVAALNAEIGPGTYDFLDAGTLGQGVITVGLIYKPDVLSLAGTAILETAAFTDPNNTGGPLNRPALAVSMEVSDPAHPDFGEAFTLVVNHLKSKGNSGVDANSPDADQGDGQGNWNDTRTKAMTALLNWLATDPTGVNDPDVLILGDLNAYRNEDPITTLEAAGYTDLLERFVGDTAYTFVFDGQTGYLDHALANGPLLPQVTAAAAWHINADEVNVFDYNNSLVEGNEAFFEAKPSGNPLFAPDAFRSSDHDPVIVGLDLGEVATSLRNTENQALKLELLPNPTSGPVQVKVSGGLTGDGVLQVYDPAGRRVRVLPLRKAGSVMTKNLNLAGLAAGLYTLELRIGGKLLATRRLRLSR